MKILTVRGARDCLVETGMEHLLASAELVINLNDSKVRDRYGQIYDHEHCSVDPPETVLFQCVRRIKIAWEETHVAESHLGHAAVGLWLCYWRSPNLETMERLAAEGRSDDLRAAAEDYVDAEFGNKRGPTVKLDDSQLATSAGQLPI